MPIILSGRTRTISVDSDLIRKLRDAQELDGWLTAASYAIDTGHKQCRPWYTRVFSHLARAISYRALHIEVVRVTPRPSTSTRRERELPDELLLCSTVYTDKKFLFARASTRGGRVRRGMRARATARPMLQNSNERRR